MIVEEHGDWRKIGNSLYRREFDTFGRSAFVHVAVCPPRIISLKAAVAWFVAAQEENTHG